MSSSTQLMKEGSVVVWKDVSGTPIYYSSGMAIDADGAPNAYHQQGSPPGLDYLGNAGQPGNWWGIVTDTGESDGNPIIQKSSDPCPGFYVSPTSLVDKNLSTSSPRRYVDSTTIPYIALPGDLIKAKYAYVGDFAIVYNTTNQKQTPAIVGDVGPSGKIGEGSIALATALGVNSSPHNGGTSGGLFYIVFPASRLSPSWPLTVAQITSAANALFTTWGGQAKLNQTLADLQST